MSEYLKEVNNAGLLESPLKPKIKPEQLVINAVYKIVKFTRLTTVYGPCIRVELEESVVFLPRRYLSVIPEDKIEDLNRQKLGLVFRGMKATPHRPTPLLEIVSL